MEALEKGKHKLGEICEILRKETLEPAQGQAQEIIESAKAEGHKIIEKAQEEAKQILKATQLKIEQENRLFQNSLELAAKQCFELLKQQVDNQLFSAEIEKISDNLLSDKEIMGKLVAAVVTAITKEGLEANLSIAVARHVDVETISAHLVGKIAERLKKGEIKLENIPHGASIKILDKKISVDISSQSLKDLFGSFLRDSFREILFKKI